MRLTVIVCTMKFCSAEDACGWGSWISIAPALFILILLATSLPIPLPPRFHRIFRLIRSSFKSYLTLDEAEALDLASPLYPYISPSIPNPGSRWRSVLFAFVGLLESLVWVADTSFYLVATQDPYLGVIRRSSVALSWIYTTVRPIAHPLTTVPYDLFTVYVLHFVAGSLQLGGYIFESMVSDVPLPAAFVLLGLSAHLAVLVMLLFVTIRMPMALPSTRVRTEDIVSSIVWS